MKYVLLIITILSCCYAIYANHSKKTVEICLAILIKKLYNPKNDYECNLILEELIHEFDKLEE